MNNIQYYRIRAGLTQQEFAEKMNAGQSTVSQWENGKRIPSLETVIKIAGVFGIDPSLLIDKNNSWKEINIRTVPEFADDSYMVPIVASLRCGYNEAGKRVFDVIKKEELPPSYRVRYGEDVVLVKAIGESMLPSIRPKDLLICKPGDAWQDGDTVVVNVDDSDTIKKIYRAKDGGIDLVPNNEKFRKMHFTPEDLIDYPPHVLGKVLRNYGQDI